MTVVIVPSTNRGLGVINNNSTDTYSSKVVYAYPEAMPTSEGAVPIRQATYRNGHTNTTPDDPASLDYNPKVLYVDIHEIITGIEYMTGNDLTAPYNSEPPPPPSVLPHDMKEAIAEMAQAFTKLHELLSETDSEWIPADAIREVLNIK